MRSNDDDSMEEDWNPESFLLCLVATKPHLQVSFDELNIGSEASTSSGVVIARWEKSFECQLYADVGVNIQE